MVEIAGTAESLGTRPDPVQILQIPPKLGTPRVARLNQKASAKVAASIKDLEKVA